MPMPMDQAVDNLFYAACYAVLTITVFNILGVW